MMMLRLLPFALFALRLVGAADFTPTAPGPGDKFVEGGSCTVQWNPDDTGAWKTTNIQLMTGPNNPMIHLSTVGTVDGSDPTKTSFTFTCPKVTLHSAVYFLQFTAQGIPNVTWTGRWAITDATGALTAPPNATQPDGESIPWGAGQLLGTGTPPPSTAPAGQIDGSKGPASLADTTPASPVASTNSSSASSAPVSSSAPTSSAAKPAPPPSGMTTVVSSAPLASTTASSTSSNSTTSSGANNGAVPLFMSPFSILAAAVFGAFVV